MVKRGSKTPDFAHFTRVLLVSLQICHGSRDAIDMVKQSAALCLLRLFRASPDMVPGGEWTSRIVHLLNDQNMGVVTAASSLIDSLVKRNPSEYKACVSLAVSRLSRVSRDICFLKSSRLILTDIDCRLLLHPITIYRITLIILSQHLGFP